MKNMIFYVIYFLLISYKNIICFDCVEGKNFCKLCNPLTKLCAECYNKDVLKPDENGGCEGIKKCEIGENFCEECNRDGDLCLNCETGYIPDENGGCSYTNNCEISSEGVCIKCIEDFILIGKTTYNDIYDNIKICKYNNSEEFKNCDVINSEKGGCQICSKDYYLTGKDKKCVKTQYCAESKFGVCKVCNPGYYLDKSQEKCLQLKGDLLHCKISIDGKTCDTCIDNYYFDEKGVCISNNYCLVENDYKCEKCSSGYFLSKNYECTPDENCKKGKKDLGICVSCNDYYYIDYKDGKCKPNYEENDFRYCTQVEGDVCTKCVDRYHLTKDNKCTITERCAEAENGVCVVCENNYYLGLDNKCNSVQNCIYSNLQGECIECIDNYYYDTSSRKCVEAENEFLNCKKGDKNAHCEACKNDFYINETDHLCYSNLNKDEFYKCASTDSNAEKCVSCIDGYYIGSKDNLCSTVEGCEITEDENRCSKCESNFYCLDQKTGKCELNYQIEKEEQIIYYRCNMTNDEGTKCQQCIEEEDQYIINDEGICVEEDHCTNKTDGICQECMNEIFDSYCLNDIFGCVKSIYNNCLECNDIFHLGTCTKCHEGYELNKYNICVKINN